MEDLGYFLTTFLPNEQNQMKCKLSFFAIQWKLTKSIELSEIAISMITKEGVEVKTASEGQ